MRIGLLTGGGDCPGLNAAIRAVVRYGESRGDQIVGFHHGWLGVVNGEASPLTVAETKGLLQSGGTVLRTARFHPDEHEGGTDAAFATVSNERLDVLIVIGGDGTLGSASNLADLGMPIIGIPKTIDNDVFGTNRCIGFDTAVATAADAVDRVHSTGESHDRLMVVELMGRNSGWLALCAGIAAGADVLCIPEIPSDTTALAKAIQRRHDAGSSSSVVVVAEGAVLLGDSLPAEGSAGARVATALRVETGYETRLTVLGHIQRGGAPTPGDRLLATSCGVAAVDAAHDGEFSTLIATGNDETLRVPLRIVSRGSRPVPQSLLAVGRALTVA